MVFSGTCSGLANSNRYRFMQKTAAGKIRKKAQRILKLIRRTFAKCIGNEFMGGIIGGTSSEEEKMDDCTRRIPIGFPETWSEFLGFARELEEPK